MADKLFGKLLDNYVNEHSSSAYSSIVVCEGNHTPPTVNIPSPWLIQCK